jgi:glycerophosphoryl diester phosphodiesterase
MEIIGHRGAAGLAPGNTRASFKAAILAGVDWIEFDVRATADGRVVLLHDSHTLRLGPRPRFVSRSTYAQLKSLKTYSGQPILTIAEAFNAIGTQAGINVHIKTAGCAAAAVHNIERLVKKGASYEKFLVSSFRVSHLREIHRLNSKIPLGLLHATRPYRFLKLRGLRVQAVGFYHRRLPQKAIEQAELRELVVYAYTVNRPKRARELSERGVKAIVTNRPDRLRADKT